MFFVDVISHREEVGCPKPPPSPHPKVVTSTNKEEEDEDTNPFLRVISDGEDSAKEEEDQER